MTKVIRNVFARIGHALETNLVDPREEYQAALLGDPVATHAHDGDYARQARIRNPHLVGEDRKFGQLKRVA